MNLPEYFIEDDGSLPEIRIAFSEPDQLVHALALLLSRGGRNVAVGGGVFCIDPTEPTQSFNGIADAARVANGTAHYLQIVLAGVRGTDQLIPDLGVYIEPNRMDLDYKMGPHWGCSEIDSFLELLRQLVALGGIISIPWWGAKGEHDFSQALGA